MASVMFGGGITAAVGSHGGNTFARNRAGAHVRKRTKGVNPSTTKQRQRQANMHAMTRWWTQTLSAGQRAAWRSYAAANPVLNRLGQSQVLSGQQMFVKLGGVLATAGFSWSNVPPGTLTMATPTDVQAILTKDPGGSVKVQPVASGTTTGQAAYVWASATYNPGRSFISSGLRFLGSYALGSGSPITVTTDYTNVFGSLPKTAGGTVFFRFAVYDQTYGVITPYIQQTYAWT